MANDFFSRISSKIDDLCRLVAAPTIRVLDFAARFSLGVPENKLEDIIAILNNIKALLYDLGRQIREDAIKLWLKEFQDLVIVVEDFADDYRYKMFQSEADIADDHQYKMFPSQELTRRQIEARRLAKGNQFEKRKTDAFPRRNKPAAIKIPLNIFVGILGMKLTYDDILAQHQKAQKCASHLLLISQEKQNSEKLQRVTEFLLAESSRFELLSGGCRPWKEALQCF